jgi:hypothetical protein
MSSIRLVSNNPAPTSQSGDDGGPEDPMLERVARLETDLAEIKLTLVKLDAKLDKLDNKLDAKLDKFDGKQTASEERLNGKLAGLEGHLSGIGHRFTALPTTWTILGIVFTTWAIGSGILIFAMNFLKR